MLVKDKITTVELTEKQLNAVRRSLLYRIMTIEEWLMHYKNIGEPKEDRKTAKAHKKDKEECVATLEYFKKGV